MKPIFDSTLHEILNKRLGELENHFAADFLFYYGPITDSLDKPFRDLVEELKTEPDTNNTLFIHVQYTGRKC